MLAATPPQLENTYSSLCRADPYLGMVRAVVTKLFCLQLVFLHCTNVENFKHEVRA